MALQWVRFISLKHGAIIFLQSLDQENMVLYKNNLVYDFSSFF